MTWGLVGIGMRSTSWMRPGSQGKLLRICLLGGVFLVVFVRHLFLGDLLLLVFFSPSGWFCCLFSYMALLWVLLFLLLLYILCDHCGFWVLGSGSLVVFLLAFFSAGKTGFPCFFCCYIWSVVVFICFNILSCYQVGSLVRLLLTRC